MTIEEAERIIAEFKGSMFLDGVREQGLSDNDKIFIAEQIKTLKEAREK